MVQGVDAHSYAVHRGWGWGGAVMAQRAHMVVGYNDFTEQLKSDVCNQRGIVDAQSLQCSHRGGLQR